MTAAISVVMPCYRAAATLGRAIESVAAQTERPAELIVVDDASGDASSALLDELVSRYAAGWLRIESLPRNCGAATARNHGWDLSIGEFVAFLDADDTWHPRKLELQLAFMRAHPLFTLSGHGHVIGMPPADLSPLEWREVGFEELLWRNPFVTPSVMARRGLSLRFSDGQRHMEDHLLWQRCAAAGYRIARIDLPLASLYKRPFVKSGLSSNLLRMEAGDLLNYKILYQEGRIGAAKLLVLWAWSLVRFARRLVIVGLGRFR